MTPDTTDDDGTDGSRAADPVAEAAAELARAAQEAAALADEVARAGDGPAGGPVPAVPADAAAVKQRMAGLRRAALEQQERVAAAQERLKDEMERQMSAARAAIEPMRDLVERLEEGIWTISLYTGRNEEIVALADGPPAPAATPISVRQLVLSMDQETMIASEEGGIDASRVEDFDQWVTADPAHLHQVLPEPKGVVVLVPRVTHRNYGDPLLQQHMDRANKQSYWLVRNGGKLWRMTTDFDVGERLVPHRDEFTGFFTDRRGRTLEPGTDAWLRAEKAAGDRQRHYMRAALVLQGLIDRTVVFHPLPAPTVSLLSPPSYEAGHVVLVTDDELQLGTGRKPFYEWLADTNAGLRPGMRIVGAFDTTAFRELTHDYGYRAGHERLTPPNASYPPAGEVHRIERRDPTTGGLVFKYDRTDDVFDPDSFTYRPAKNRASCTIYPHDKFVVAVDLVDPDEIEAYLHARTERHAYVDMVPLLKAVVASKRAEAEQERPFRLLLAGEIAKRHGVTPTEAADGLDEIVRWWKLANRWHRPLVDPDPRTQTKAVTAITAEWQARRAARQPIGSDAAQVARLRGLVPDAMLVARTRDGGYVALEPQSRAYPEPVAARNVWVREHTTGKTARAKVAVREWVLPGSRPARWHVLWNDERWDSWDTAASASEHLTDPEVAETVAAALAAADRIGREGPERWHKRGEPEPGRNAAVAYDHRGTDPRGTFVVYRLSDSPGPAVPGRLLTESLPDLRLTTLRVAWRRSTGGRVVREPDTSFGDTLYDTARAARRAEHPWDERGRVAVWSDADVVADIDAAAAVVAEAREKARRLHDTAVALRRSVHDEWTARVEKAAYEQFVDDYADPERWPAHRKTLRLGQPGITHGLEHAVDRLVEDGHDLDGLTVAEAADLYAQQDAGQPVDVPVDVASLTFRAPDDR